MISVDTNVLIWGVQHRSAIGREHMIPIAKAFFAHVRDDKIPVVIPAQVLAEFLVLGTQEERDDALRKLDNNFVIAPLDFLAATIASELAANKKLLHDAKAEFGLTREIVKADIKVIAISMASGATRLITGNTKEMKSLAQGKIIVDDIEEFVAKIAVKPPSPDPAKQKSFPGLGN